MTEQKRSSMGADVRTVVQAALLVLGTGVTILDGWMLSGVSGVVGAVIFAAMFLGCYYAISKDGESTNGRIIGLAVCVGVTLLVCLSVLLSNR